MAVIKCKMCGGDIELAADKTFGTCEFCGSTMTLPKVDDDQRAAAFNRGNHFRRIGEFDKALAVYERIVREDDTDAEAHWCCALCRFGIEYVEDPATYEWLPTCHRASFDSFLEDVDYLAALEHSDGITRRQYQKDGAKIAEVQRGILATSQNEEPFDVFICYKESDENGERTKDSLMAQDIYYQLTDQGYRVFFSRITLEDMAGREYEPYIFAALNSAKVMIVVGTKPEYLNAVWVKNEWSRFLVMMKKDRHKLLLPCYRDMDPYDMPEQLAVLQSYDMGKIGFIQDLSRGISKVLNADKKPEPVKETLVVQQAAAPAPASDVGALLRRVEMFLEDEDWQGANEYCEKVLDIDPENARAYLGKLMAGLRVRNQADLKNCAQPFDDQKHYEKIQRFGDEALRAELSGYVKHIKERNEETRLNGIYNNAKSAMNAAKTVAEYLAAARLFDSIDSYRDSAALAKESRRKGAEVEEARKENIYREAVKIFSTAANRNEYSMAAVRFDSIAGYKDSSEQREIAKKRMTIFEARALMGKGNKDGYYSAITTLRAVSGFENADELMDNCKREIERIEEEAKKAAAERKRIAEQRKRTLKRALITTAVVAVLSLAGYLLTIWYIIPEIKYKKAAELMEAGNYREAIDAFEALEGHKDSEEQIDACNAAVYDRAVAFMEAGNHRMALAEFSAITGYKDSAEQANALRMLLMGGFVSAGGNHTVGLKVDGTVVAVGSNQQGQCDVKSWSDIIAISAGFHHTVGLKADGTAVAVGDNRSGQCKVAGWSDIVAISAGSNHTVGLKVDGAVVATGRNNEDQCDVGSWSDIVAISAGGYHTVGLKTDGTVVAVGNNDYGQCDVESWSDIIAISAGANHTVGLKADGTVVAVGNNVYGQCNAKSWSDIVSISAGDYHTVGLKADGTVVAVGNNAYGQCNVKSWSDIVSISAGSSHAVGLKADGTVVAVGYNEHGRCNVAGWKNIKTPETAE